MELITKAPKGTKDVLPSEAYIWRYVEKTVSNVAHTFGFGETRTPTFEHTELFLRSVGETTDVVQKEMYTFEDKKGRSITLKPEGTAGILRAAVENGLVNQALPVKLYYITPCFRHEKPQSGRLREFHQFGVEMLGAGNPEADVDTIRIAYEILNEFHLSDITLEINSIGCPECRKQYQEALKAYYAQYKDSLCETCLDRLDRNPMRLLDCKSEICSTFAKDAPIITDYLCRSCAVNYEEVKTLLKEQEIPFQENPRIVRGLDYYTNTVFEFISKGIGSQGTVCAGGRYNGLLQEIGGKDLPGVGFAMGLERVIMLMKFQDVLPQQTDVCDIYIAGMNPVTNRYASKLAVPLRKAGLRVEFDLMGRGLNAQMKYADKLGASYTIVIGEQEITDQKVILKNMNSGEKHELCLGDGFVESVLKILR